MVASAGEVERFSSFAVLGLSEASVIVIDSLGGLADERLVDAGSNVWDNNLAPKED